MASNHFTYRPAQGFTRLSCSLFPLPYSLLFHPAQKARHFFQRPLRGGQADALQPPLRQGFQPLQRERQVRAAGASA